MHIFGPTSDDRRYYLFSILSILAFSIPTNFAAGFQGKGWGHSGNQLSINCVGPNSGPQTGGTSVTISGVEFTPSASVAFGGVAAPSVIYVSSTQLQTVIPAHTGGIVSVTIAKNPHNQSTTPAGGFTNIAGSRSDSIGVSGTSPAQRPTSCGTVVTITGNGLQSGAAVAFSSTQSASWASPFTFHSVDLLWNAPSSSAATMEGYNVYRGKSLASPFGRLNGSFPVDVTSSVDATVRGGTPYYYDAKSVDANGAESAPAGHIQATTSP